MHSETLTARGRAPGRDGNSGKDGSIAPSTAVAGTATHLLDLATVFLPSDGPTVEVGEVLRADGFIRIRVAGKVTWLLDRFGASGVACAALRCSGDHRQQLTISLNSGYGVQTAAVGGWLLTPNSPDLDAYWIPQPPMLRQVDADGHILSYRQAVVSGLDISASRLAAHFDRPAGWALDIVVWRIPAGEFKLMESLRQPSALELQHYFMWSSHTAYARPADLYLHWVHGHVYENHEVWPRYWRVCSELDAYALYVTLTGLLRTTGKALYDLLRQQVVFSVIARQADDGGWYHGEWTDDMESHYRLHAGAMHLLAAYFEETRDAVVGAALGRAAAYASTKTDQLEAGTWYLHDSLELSTTALRRYPFRYVPSRALGKAESNLLVLNTHLDTNIAMARHRYVTGDARHEGLIASAHAAAQRLLALRPADWLYRPLFRAIGLTFLPTARAKALPVHLRALKRLAWKYIIPALPRLKARLPRLVMPGGYIERELTMQAFSVRYQPVNLMDLVRTRRLFDDPTLDPLLRESFAFTHGCGITARWKEAKGKEDDSLGFWAEALYHLSLATPDQRYRDWLAEAILDLEDNKLGLPPSILGANAEAVPPAEQRPCLQPIDSRLRVVNLCRGEAIEWIVVNPTDGPIELEWRSGPEANVVWRLPRTTGRADTPQSPTIPARSWVHGRGNCPAPK